MRFEYDGIALWYETADAPAPENIVPVSTEIPLNIGVQPIDASNKVEVRYRINQGEVQIIPAKILRSEPYRQVQYFRAYLPALRSGDKAEYSVICRCAGRQVPNPNNSEQWSSFTVASDNNSDLLAEPTSQPLPTNRKPKADTRISTTPITVQNPPSRPEFAEERELFITREIIGQLLDKETNSPVAGFTVCGSKLGNNKASTDIGCDISNGRGYFSFTYTIPQSETKQLGTQNKLAIKILDSSGKEFHKTVVNTSSNSEQILQIAISVPKTPEPPSPTLSQLFNLRGLRSSSALLTGLSNRGIKTLADLRKAGGVVNIPELSQTVDKSSLQKIQAHTNLSTISDDIQLNSNLIAKRFDSVAKIARTTREDFVSAIGEQQGDFKAAQLQIKARAQTNFLNNIAASVGADLANGLPNPFTDDSVTTKDVFKPTCSCQSCEAATSPIAYLADLLDFTISKVKNNNTAITFEYLANTFHQPFDLPASCEIQQQRERQVRLCIEVLRSYLSANPPTTTAAVLEQAEKQYALNAYQILLNQIGTSYDELRQTRGDTEAQEALAKRLGIALDKLDLLFLDPDGEVTEATLERIFGFKATKGFGKKQGDPLNQVVSWNFAGVELGQNTDPNGYVYLNLGLIRGIAEYVWTVDVFKDIDRTQLVARGSTASIPETSLVGDPADLYQGNIELNAIANSGLTGTVTLDYRIGSNEIALLVEDEFSGLLSWRLEYLRTLWQEQDWSEDLPEKTPPIIDPDLIGLAYLTNWSNPDDPAYQLWQARTEWLETKLNELKTYTQDTNGLDELFTAIASELGIPITTNIVEIYADLEAGNDISSTLDELNLTNGGFLYLVRVRNLLANDNPVLSSEWEEVYNIFLQALKIGQFQTWREQERDNQVILSPDSFQIPVPPPLEFPPPEPQPLPEWRATQQALRTWKNKLKSRIDRKQSIKEGLQTAISATEEATLPLLRDALIMAMDIEGDNLNTKADWITKNLLIDAQAGSCQETTRIAQAIETIQGLLWGLKINQFRETYPNLELGDRENFDEKWKWLGSYANWRSAMLVFLYPENILRPELRKYQTPAFRQLVKNVRNNRRLTPDRACQEAKAYSDYFADIATLKIEATCQTRTRLHTGDCRDRIATTYSNLFHMFARGGKTNTVYWSAYDSQDESGYAQTFWEAVSGLETEKVLNIIGAVPYTISDDERYIYLFVLTQGDNGQKLGFTTYNLQTQQWKGQLTELEVPEDAASFSAVVEQRDDENESPYLAIQIESKKIYSRSLNTEGTDWRGDLFRLLSDDLRITEMYSLIGFFDEQNNWRLYLFAKLEIEESNTVQLQVGVTLKRYSNITIPLWRSFGTASWIGAFQYPNTIEMYVFIDKNTEKRYGKIATISEMDEPITLTNPAPSQLDKIAVHSGHNMALSGRRLAYQNKSGQIGVYKAVFRQLSGDLINLSSPSLVAPRVAGPLSITEQLSDEKLHIVRCLIKIAFEQNENGSSSNLTYLKEIYYFVPISLALQLQQKRYFPAALNWYRNVYTHNLTIIDPNQSTNGNQPNFCETPPEDQPKIYYGLKLEESLPEVYQRAEDWLLDPLNPHLIATSRRNTYTRFTLLSIIRCFLEYADNEFTRDTAESVPRARTLYLTALELFDRLGQQARNCQQLIDSLDTEISNQLKIDASELLPVWHQIKRSLLKIKDEEILNNVVQQIEIAIAREQPWISKLINAQTIIDQAFNSLPLAPNLKKLLEGKKRQTERIYASFSTQTEVSNALKKVGDIASKDYLNAVSIVSGITTQALEKEKIQLPWLRQKTMATAANNGSLSSNQTLMREDYQRLTSYNPVAPTHIANLAQIAKTYPLQAVQIVQTQPNNFVPSPIYSFCLPLNPVLDSLRLWAELNLYKLRTCRNIAGIERELAPYAAPTDILSGLPQIGTGGQLILPGAISFPATPYRYAVLIERAKQLVSIAQQIEASFLSALEKLDAELYSLLKARQDMQSARAGVILQNLRVREAVSGVTLVELQKERSEIQVAHYHKLINGGIYKGISWGEALSSVVSAGNEIGLAIASGGTTAVIGAITGGFGLAGTFSSFERREQEWKFQRKLAQQDVRIGEQQIAIALDRVRVVGQERVISQMQADFAEETLDFLTTKFSSAEFYDWMVGILEGVYSFFLQQATSTAKLAENQLAFERQEVTPSYIQADYWEVPNDNFATSQNNNTPDRRGLTGSARLLQDIYQLDQYAFDTDRRKLQLTKTISLARLAPAEFQGFRETGVMLFSTPMELFDRDFPGHYLRLIKRVRTSIIALIPPIEGIKATLSTTGLSRVVTGQNNLFQTNEIVRPPESVALTSPRDATGLFELTSQSQEMLLPFENFGVDTSWELRLPKASNLFDYNTIADVLITIEYTALNSFTYRQTVLDELGDTFSGDRPFSFRNQFADAWYDLNNPDQTDNPMVVTFETTREDFPANIDNLKIQHLVLYFVLTEGEMFKVPITLNFTEQNSTSPCGGSATPIDGVISTRRGNASEWSSITEAAKTPAGKWVLALPDPDTTKTLFEEEAIEDILFVITYSGQIP